MRATAKILRPLTENSTPDNPRVAYRLTDNGIVTYVGKQRQQMTYTFDVTRLTMLRYIPDTDAIPAKDLLKLAYLSYLYTLRLCDTRMMRRLTSVPRDTITQMKDNVFCSIDLVRFKIATMRCVVQQLTPKYDDKIRRNFMECGLRSEDAIMFHLLYHNNDIPEFVKYINQIEDATFTLDVNTLVNELEHDAKARNTIYKTAGYVAFSRLSFMARGNRVPISHYQSDLFEKGMQAYRWVRPFYSKAHALNYAKRTVDGQALVMIEKAEKNDMEKRTIATKDGFDNIMRAYSDEECLGNPFGEEDEMIERIDEMHRLRTQ